MKAIILAAGIGKRLKPITDNNPKCLLKINGSILIERELDALISARVNEVVIVVGYLKDKIESHLGQRYKGASIRYITNDRYDRGSVLSLWCAGDELKDGAIIMDADVLFPEEFISKLLLSKFENCFLLDEIFEDSGEEMKLGVDYNGRVFELSRSLSKKYPVCGEGVGFVKISKDGAIILRKKLDEFIKGKRFDSEYEEAINEILGLSVFGFEKVNGSLWTEIDCLKDIDRAKAIVSSYKKSQSITSITVDRRISQQLTKILSLTSITPNQITLCSLFTGLLSGYLFCIGNYLSSLLAGVLFWISYIFDNCDGELARLKNMKSIFGEYFDIISDIIVYIAIFTGITAGIYRMHPTIYTLLLGIASMIGVIVSFFLVQRLEKKGKGPAMQDRIKYGTQETISPLSRPGKLLNRLGNIDFSIIIFFFALFGAMKLFLIITSIGSNVFWLSLIMLNRNEKT